MLHQLFNLHSQSFILACSGGVDSLAITDFYRRGKKKFALAYFDHNTGNSVGALSVIRKYADQYNLQLHVGKLDSPKPPDLSLEEHWRNERYEWLTSFGVPVVTCHHLNDCAESWLMGTMHGSPRLIAYSFQYNNVSVHRPFLTNRKQDIIDWCLKHNVEWFEDISNNDVTHPRNRIRHNIMPEVLKINPGFLTVIKKKYLRLLHGNYNTDGFLNEESPRFIMREYPSTRRAV